MDAAAVFQQAVGSVIPRGPQYFYHPHPAHQGPPPFPQPVQPAAPLRRPPTQHRDDDDGNSHRIAHTLTACCRCRQASTHCLIEKEEETKQPRPLLRLLHGDLPRSQLSNSMSGGTNIHSANGNADILLIIAQDKMRPNPSPLSSLRKIRICMRVLRYHTRKEDQPLLCRQAAGHGPKARGRTFTIYRRG